MEGKNPVVWFEIYVEDLNRAKKFYETILSVQLTEAQMPESVGVMEMLFFPMQMNGEGAAGALVKMDAFKPGGNSTLIYFSSEDCSIEEGRIKNAGGKVVQPKQSIGESGYIVLAKDTEGNMFGLHSRS